MPVIEHPEALFAASNDATLDTTVCVIGSGFAGAVTAVELAKAGLDVVVLEAGSEAPDHRLDPTIDRLDVDGVLEIKFGLVRQLGGASNLWAGRLAPFDPIDFEPRPWVAGSGWPFAAGELEAWYPEADHILRIPGVDVFREHRRASPDFLPRPDIEIKSFQWAPQPFNAREYLTSAAGRRDNLRVLGNAAVTALEEDSGARRVVRAQVTLRNHGVAGVRAGRFVVAGGGIETPRLLLNSRGVRGKGIGNDHDVVGRYLSTHPKANMATLFLHRPVSTRHALFADASIPGGVLRYGLGFSAAAQERLRLLNHYVQVLPFLEHRANRAFEFFRHSDAFNSPLIDRARLIRGFIPGLGLMLFDKMGRLGGVQRRARQFVLRAFLDQYPDPENRVTLSTELNERGMPRANVAWRFSADDRASVLEFFTALANEVDLAGIGRLEFEKLKRISEWPLIGLHSHFMGTTRMGTDPRTSVTNADGRVHGSDNLFICGPSLFPTYGFANPVYTIAALALRLADHLKTLAVGTSAS